MRSKNSHILQWALGGTLLAVARGQTSIASTPTTTFVTLTPPRCTRDGVQLHDAITCASAATSAACPALVANNECLIACGACTPGPRCNNVLDPSICESYSFEDCWSGTILEPSRQITVGVACPAKCGTCPTTSSTTSTLTSTTETFSTQTETTVTTSTSTTTTTEGCRDSDFQLNLALRSYGFSFQGQDACNKIAARWADRVDRATWLCEGPDPIQQLARLWCPIACQIGCGERCIDRNDLLGYAVNQHFNVQHGFTGLTCTTGRAALCTATGDLADVFRMLCPVTCNICTEWTDFFLPTASPTSVPSTVPTMVPSFTPSATPSAAPSFQPSRIPTNAPTLIPTSTPTNIPTSTPSSTPTSSPTNIPTERPTTAMPSTTPTLHPTKSPSAAPSAEPTATPTGNPTKQPTSQPSKSPTSTRPTSQNPTAAITAVPTVTPTLYPTSSQPTSVPTLQPSTGSPTVTPVAVPTVSPTLSSAPTLVQTCVVGEDHCNTCDSTLRCCAQCSGSRFLQDCVCVDTCREGCISAGLGEFGRTCRGCPVPRSSEPTPAQTIAPSSINTSSSPVLQRPPSPPDAPSTVAPSQIAIDNNLAGAAGDTADDSESGVPYLYVIIAVIVICCCFIMILLCLYLRSERRNKEKIPSYYNTDYVSPGYGLGDPSQTVTSAPPPNMKKNMPLHDLNGNFDGNIATHAADPLKYGQPPAGTAPTPRGGWDGDYDNLDQSTPRSAHVLSSNRYKNEPSAAPPVAAVVHAPEPLAPPPPPPPPPPPTTAALGRRSPTGPPPMGPPPMRSPPVGPSSQHAVVFGDSDSDGDLPEWNDGKDMDFRPGSVASSTKSSPARGSRARPPPPPKASEDRRESFI